MRTASYDSLGDLMSSSNPETGTINYTYDLAGNLSSRVDARGEGVYYCYDNLDRLTGKAYTAQSSCSSMTSPVDQYTYDTTSVSGSSHTDGQLTSAVAYNGGTVVAQDAPYVYDAMGRMKDEYQCGPANCSGTQYSLQYTYNQEGDVTSANNGYSNPGLTVSYQYDSVGRLTTVSATLPWSDQNHLTTLFSNPSYGPTALLSADLGLNNSSQSPVIALARTYDDRLRIDSETDFGYQQPEPGVGTLSISGSEKSTAPTPATGSATISGSEQSTQVQTAAATSSTGSIGISGSEQQKSIAATSGSGSITINGSERSVTIQEPCGPNGQTCPQTIYDAGPVSVTINGTTYQSGYSETSTTSNLASAIASMINGGPDTNASVSGSTIILTARATGAATNYSLSASSSTGNSSYFSGPSFTASPSGSTLTGGKNSSTDYDSGTVKATVDGCTGTASYGQGSSTGSVASSLASALASSCSSIVSTGVSGSTVTLSSKSTGSGVNWPISTAVTYNSSQFSSASFGASPSGMSGGKNATDKTVYDSGTVKITVNGHTDSASFGQNDTTATIASNLVSAINGDGSAPVTAALSGNTVDLTTKQTGTSVNYSLSTSDSYDTSNFSHSSFTASASGSTLTGGASSGGTVVYDSGSVSLTIDGTTETANYGQGDTASSVASKLANAFSGNANVSVIATGSSLDVAARATGSATNYSYSFTETHGSYFSSPSFTGSPSSGTLSGGENASTTGTPVYSYNIGTSGYLANGDVHSYTDSVMGAWSWTYDDLNRLSGGSSSSGKYSGYSDCFTYDNFGNRTDEAFSTTGCGSSPTPTTWASFSTSNRVTGTNLRPAGYSYDAAGNITDDGVNQYLYDNEERVCAVQNMNTGSMTEYLYDAAGNRIAKGSISVFSCNMATNGFSLTTSYVVGPGGNQLSVVNQSGGWQESYIYAGGKLLGYYTNTGTDFVLTDWIGTKRAVVGADGQLASAWCSLPFGNNLQQCGGSATDPSDIHFTGKQRDSESGNDYFGARYYASTMGRWLTPDWASGAAAVPYASFGSPQSLNLYAFVGNNPLSSVDPDGHQAQASRIVCSNGQNGGQCGVGTDPFNGGIFTSGGMTYVSPVKGQENFQTQNKAWNADNPAQQSGAGTSARAIRTGERTYKKPTQMGSVKFEGTRYTYRVVDAKGKTVKGSITILENLTSTPQTKEMPKPATWATTNGQFQDYVGYYVEPKGTFPANFFNVVDQTFVVTQSGVSTLLSTTIQQTVSIDANHNVTGVAQITTP